MMKKRMMAMLMTAILIVASVPFTAFAEETPAEVLGGEVMEAAAAAAEAVEAKEAAEEPAAAEASAETEKVEAEATEAKLVGTTEVEIEVGTWAELQDEINSAKAPITITLAEDVTAGETEQAITINGDKNITLDLNGHSLDRGLKERTAGNTGYVIVLNKGELTIRDSSDGETGTITGGMNLTSGGAIYVYSETSLILESGTITGNDVGNRGGGVFVGNGGNFTMTGGTITGNKAGNAGGGVFVSGGGHFTMTGGEISENTKGGVKVDSKGTTEVVDGVFTMTGGAVSTNEDYGVNISGKMKVGGTARVTGNYEIKGETQKKNNVYLLKGQITIDNPPQEWMMIGVTTYNEPTEGMPVVFTSNGTAEDVKYFKADNAEYAVEFKDGHLQLVKGAPSKGWSLDDGVLTIFGEVTYEGDDSPWSKHADKIISVVTKPGAKINNCYYLFYDCENLVSADLSHLDTSKVTNMGNMFESCGALTTLNLGGLNTSNVTNMGSMFTLCASLEKIDLSTFNTSKVIDMSYMFNGCGNLKTIFAGENFKTDKVSDCVNIFNKCNNLKGGAGTTFEDKMKSDITYARIDDPAHGKPGLFTEKKPLRISTDKSVYKPGETIYLSITTTGIDLSKNMIYIKDGVSFDLPLTIYADGKGEYQDSSKTAAGTYTYKAYVKEKQDIYDEVTVTVKAAPEPSSEDNEPLFTGTWNNPVRNGKWTQDANGIWSYTTTQTFRSTWGYIENPYAGAGQNKADWFYFDQYGHMLTGWQWIMWKGELKCYYLNPTKDGTLGACLIGPGKTPDGWEIDETGAWIGK